MTLLDPNTIPGMIEPAEQALLIHLAKTTDFSDGKQAVEFGAFFERSTTCLANGMTDNPSREEQAQLHVYDSFSCDSSAGFISQVMAYARSTGTEALLKQEGKKISCLPVFSYYLKHHVDCALVVPYAQELGECTSPVGNIALMHIDSPKFYQEFKTILFRFFSGCIPGCRIVFQDYFYHWSASLIAAIELRHLYGLMNSEIPRRPLCAQH